MNRSTGLMTWCDWGHAFATEQGGGQALGHNAMSMDFG